MGINNFSGREVPDVEYMIFCVCLGTQIEEEVIIYSSQPFLKAAIELTNTKVNRVNWTTNLDLLYLQTKTISSK